MTVVAVSMVKDEADIIHDTVVNLLQQVDYVVVADNMSSDSTRQQLEDFQHTDRVLVLDDAEVGYFQSAKMTGLATIARKEFGAEWIVPFDADEWWYSPFGRIADVLEEVAGQWLVVPAPIYDHVGTDRDPRFPQPTRRMVHRRPTPNPLRKVACRWREDMVIEQGNHSATYDGGATVFDPVLTVRHFPYRSVEQFIRKIRNGSAAYAATQLPDDLGAHWRQWGRFTDEQLEFIFKTWYWRVNPNSEYLVDGEILEALVKDPVHAL